MGSINSCERPPLKWNRFPPAPHPTSVLGFAESAALARMTFLRAMAVVAAAITVERLAPAGERVARAIGVVVVGTGLFLIARKAGL